MNFKITVETNDLAGIEAIINQLHTLKMQGEQTDEKLTATASEVFQGTVQIYPPVQQVPIQQTPVIPPVQQPESGMTFYPEQQPQIQQPIQQAPIQTVPVQQQPTYTMQELSLATRPIVEAGRQQEVLNLLHSFMKADGSPVQTIMDMPVEQYGALAQGIRQLGGKI